MSRGMQCLHEYTNEEVMFSGLGRQDNQDFVGMTKALFDVELAAHPEAASFGRYSVLGRW
jgi:hypothetical protein